MGPAELAEHFLALGRGDRRHFLELIGRAPWAARRRRVEARNRAVARIILSVRPRRPRTLADWREIHAQLAVLNPALLLRCRLPRGATLDALAGPQFRRLCVSPRGLRDAYQRR